jgi:chemotaxis regulatin CheY-phosphate phosphatase CheZ
MASEKIAKEIGNLVDHLRAGNDEKISLTDVASATEVLLQATRMYFRSIDTSIFNQVQQMSELITAMRTDIAQLRPDDLKDEDIPRAGLELDAVVQNTEDATNNIMEAAEAIMSADLSDVDTATGTINDACMQIFESCSFQDITGQRVSKVVKTLAHIEARLESMCSDWTDELGAAALPDDSEVDTRPDADLLHGPALGGEGVDQSEVDALMGGTAVTPAVEPEETPPVESKEAAEPEPAAEMVPEPEPEPAAEATPEPEPVAEAKPEPKAEKKEKPKAPAKPKAEEKPAPKEKPKAAKAPEPVVDEEEDEGETASQADIDALFD